MLGWVKCLLKCESKWPLCPVSPSLQSGSWLNTFPCHSLLVGCGPPATIGMRILYQSKLMLNYLYNLDRTSLSMPPFKCLHKYCVSFVHNVILVITDTISIECIILEIMLSMTQSSFDNPP